MNALQVLDYYVWKFLIVRFQPAWFKSKLFSFIALLYVVLFPMPRKFLLHYFRGQGRSLSVDTRELILYNQRVLSCIKRSLENADNGKGCGQGMMAGDQLANEKMVNNNNQRPLTGKSNIRISIGQHLVSNPDHRYSIGSFILLCEHEGELLHMSVTSRYQFSGDHDRITRYLHHWMDNISENGGASRYNIEGNSWTISRQKLLSLSAYPRNRKYTDYNVLYI